MLKYLLRFIVLSLVSIALSSARAGSYDDFFIAIVNDDTGTIQSLLARGFDPNTVNPKGQTPLFLALQSGSLKAAQTLWQHPDLRIDAPNAADETPLMMAALRGQVAWCEKLVARGAAINRPGWTPLHYAASGPSAQALTWLLAHGAELEARSPNGNTALMMAARYGAEESVEALLAKGADTAPRNDQGLDAGELALRSGREALAKRISLK